MVRELMLGIGVPAVLMLLAVLALERWGHHLPSWLEWLRARRGVIWTTTMVLVIGLSLVRWWLSR